MPKFSDAEKEFIRQKLMQEGERLFVSFGIKKVSIDEIVQATGIAKGLSLIHILHRDLGI